MRLVLTTSLFALVSSMASASPDAMTASEARHLISRTGIGAAPHEITSLVGVSYADGVTKILDGIQTQPTQPMPAWIRDWAYPMADIWRLGQTTTELFYTNRWLEIEELSAWWIAEMIGTPSPMTERLTLFWHDHFATSFDAIENGQWMAAQNAFFRANAAGNFADLAQGILRDPAMLEYLSNTSNVADAPNEDLGREYLELFTLGEGRGYTQTDVQEAARALTGYGVAELGAPIHVVDDEAHDKGRKTILGQTGRHDAEDLAALVLADPAFGPYIVEKLWLEFISDQPDATEVARLSDLWKAHDLEIRPLLEAMFLSDAFWDTSNQGRLIKSPTELIVGLSRTLGLPITNAAEVGWITEDMGQSLFFPPNVGGWPSGIAWINDATATARAGALIYYLEETEDFEPHSAAMAGEPATDILRSNPQDLRVGQVFAMEAYETETGHESQFQLYDVSFGGNTWRSVTVQLEYDTSEDIATLLIHHADCGPICQANLPMADWDDNWVIYEPWDGFKAENPSVGPKDTALLAAIATHLSDMIQTTADQYTWKPDPDWPDDTPMDIALVKAAADRLKQDSDAAIGVSQAAYVLGFSGSNRLGIAGYAGGMMASDMDAYIDAQQEARLHQAIPQVTYVSARDWLNALPGTDLESIRAAEALLAVQRTAQSDRDEMIASDPDALLRSIILSPEFQVN